MGEAVSLALPQFDWASLLVGERACLCVRHTTPCPQTSKFRHADLEAPRRGHRGGGVWGCRVWGWLPRVRRQQRARLQKRGRAAFCWRRARAQPAPSPEKGKRGGVGGWGVGRVRCCPHLWRPRAAAPPRRPAGRARAPRPRSRQAPARRPRRDARAAPPPPPRHLPPGEARREAWPRGRRGAAARLPSLARSPVSRGFILQRWDGRSDVLVGALAASEGGLGGGWGGGAGLCVWERTCVTGRRGKNGGG